MGVPGNVYIIAGNQELLGVKDLQGQVHAVPPRIYLYIMARYQELLGVEDLQAQVHAVPPGIYLHIEAEQIHYTVPRRRTVPHC